MALQILIERAVPYQSSGIFTQIAALNDTGDDYSFTDTPLIAGAEYIYRARRYDTDSGLYSSYSPLLLINAPWPQGDIIMAVQSGIQSKMGIGYEATEGTGVQAQKLLNRISGTPKLTLGELAQSELRNISSDVATVPGKSTVSGTIKTHATPEGMSRLLMSAFGAPTTTNGGGTAPGTGTATPSTTGGTLPSSTAYYFKTAYERSDIGWTVANAEFTATTGGSTQTNSMSIASPASQTGASGWRLYASTTTGTEVLVATGLTIGSPYIFSDPALITNSNGQTPITSAYKIHTYKATPNSGLPVTLTEMIGGAEYFAYPGGKVTDVSWSVDKNQNSPLEIDWTIQLLNKLAYSAESDLGTDTAVVDSLPAFSPVGVTVSLGGLTADIRKIDVKVSHAEEAVDALDGTMGSKLHASTMTTVTGSFEAYFTDLGLMKNYWGQVSGASLPFGPLANKLYTSITVTWTGPVNSNGFQNRVVWTLPNVRITGHDNPVEGPGLVMSPCEFKAYYHSSTGSNISVAVWNTEANATLTTTGTPFTHQPANDMTAFTS